MAAVCNALFLFRYENAEKDNLKNREEWPLSYKKAVFNVRIGFKTA